MSIAATAFSMSAPQIAVAHDAITETTVHKFPDAAVVDGAKAVLTRMSYGISVNLDTVGLKAGDAVTMWWIIFNRPQNCSDGACGENDVFNLTGDGKFILNDDGSPPFNMDAFDSAKMSLVYADGHVIDEGGNATFRAQLPLRDTTRALLGPGLNDPWAAEIHLVLRSHAEAVAGKVDEMITTVNGGCSDVFPNPPCEDLQFAVFAPVAN